MYQPATERHPMELITTIPFMSVVSQEHKQKNRFFQEAQGFQSSTNANFDCSPSSHGNGIAVAFGQ